MATTTVISGNPVKNNYGTAVHIGAGTATIKALSLRSTAGNANLIGTEAKLFPYNGVESILRGSAVAITAITQYSSSGKVNIQKSSHGKSVGDKIMVTGCDVTAYNRVHTVTLVVDANNIKTDVNYTSNSSTHGNYYATSGNVNKTTAGKYVARIICSELAGISNSLLKSGASGYGQPPFAFARGNRRYNISTINYLTGAVTKGANAGDLVKYHNISSNNDNLTVESYPTRAVPGRIVYLSGQANPTTKNTPTITG